MNIWKLCCFDIWKVPYFALIYQTMLCYMEGALLCFDLSKLDLIYERFIALILADTLR